MKVSKSKEITIVEKDIMAVRHNLVYREEFEALRARVKNIEGKLKINSGK